MGGLTLVCCVLCLASCVLCLMGGWVGGWVRAACVVRACCLAHLDACVCVWSTVGISYLVALEMVFSVKLPPVSSFAALNWTFQDSADETFSHPPRLGPFSMSKQPANDKVVPVECCLRGGWIVTSGAPVR